MRTKNLIVNWKMHADYISIKKFFVNAPVFKDVKVMIAPSYLGILPALTLVKNNNITVISQNVALASIGNHTGSVSWIELKDYGIKTTLLGHPDVALDFGEKYYHTNAKLKKLLKNNMHGVLFICEDYLNVTKNFSKSHFQTQINELFKNISGAELLNNVTLVYKPSLNSEVGANISSDFIINAIKILRQFLRDKFGYYVANHLPLLYGGYFVNEDLEKLAKNHHLDGFLIEDERAISAKFVSLVYKHLFNGNNQAYQQFYEHNVVIDLPTEQERLIQIQKNLNFDVYDISSEFYYQDVKIEDEDI